MNIPTLAAPGTAQVPAVTENLDSGEIVIRLK